MLALVDLVGMPLLPWQKWSLTATLGETPTGLWACPTVVDLCPRQNGKSYKWAARVLAGLFVLGEELITYTAHKVDTALEVFRLVDHYARAHPSTRRRVLKTIWSQGREEIELVTGQRFRIMARTRAGGRGFPVDCLIMDEALELRDQNALNALVPTLSSRPNAQLIFASSAGDAGSVVLRELRDRGRSGEPGLAYMEYSAPDDADSDDEAAWRMANPAYGDLITPAAIRRERGIMSEEGFRQERLGIWSAEVRGRVIPATAWTATRREVEADPVAGDLGLGFDVTPDRAWASVVAAWPLDRKLHVRLSRHRPGDGWLVEELAQLALRYGVPVTYDDAGPARDIADGLARRGVPLLRVSGRDFAAASAGFLSDVVNQRLTHHPDVALSDAVAVASTRRMGEGWCFARRAGTKDDQPLSPLTAAALAVWGQRHREPEAPTPRPEVF